TRNGPSGRYVLGGRSLGARVQRERDRRWTRARRLSGRFLGLAERRSAQRRRRSLVPLGLASRRRRPRRLRPGGADAVSGRRLVPVAVAVTSFGIGSLRARTGRRLADSARPPA